MELVTTVNPLSVSQGAGTVSEWAAQRGSEEYKESCSCVAFVAFFALYVSLIAGIVMSVTAFLTCRTSTECSSPVVFGLRIGYIALCGLKYVLLLAALGKRWNERGCDAACCTSLCFLALPVCCVCQDLNGRSLRRYANWRKKWSMTALYWSDSAVCIAINVITQWDTSDLITTGITIGRSLITQLVCFC